MRELIGKRYWLVGASEGLGAALAAKLSAQGAVVILSARNSGRLEELASALPGRTEVVPCDIADDASVAVAAEAVGEIDGVIAMAGVYWPMKATEWDLASGVAMADVNFTGMMRVLGHAVPPMVARGSGHIIIAGSLSGFRGLPGAIGYGASKAAVMSLAESMYADLRGSGVDVQVVNPGFVKTRLTDKNDFSMPFLMEPEAAAQEVVDHMVWGGFKRSFPTMFSLFFRASQFFPDWLYYRIFGKAT